MNKNIATLFHYVYFNVLLGYTALLPLCFICIHVRSPPVCTCLRVTDHLEVFSLSVATDSATSHHWLCGHATFQHWLWSRNNISSIGCDSATFLHWLWLRNIPGLVVAPQHSRIGCGSATFLHWLWFRNIPALFVTPQHSCIGCDSSTFLHCL